MFKLKNIWFCLGISIGVLAGILTFVSFALPTSTPVWISFGVWPGFVAWALYFAKGGGVDAMLKTIYGNIFGILFALLTLWAWLEIGPNYGTSRTASALVLGIIVIVLAFILTMGGNFPVTSYVPAAFAGAAACFGFSTMQGASAGMVVADTGKAIQAVIALIITMALGAVLAYGSDIWGQAMNKKG
ncbi:MAG: DUF1097 domain-containing protein [Actinomycetia bacterium]|nr:DUF1097 domain-containing protein [Actinomycetes bacterium]